MKKITTIKDMKAVVRELKSGGKTIGFVPTMGYLHGGHLSLVRKSIQNADATVVSIFVNPAQFGPQEDFKEYPRDFNRDMELLKKEGVDYLVIDQTTVPRSFPYQSFLLNEQKEHFGLVKVHMIREPKKIILYKLR